MHALGLARLWRPLVRTPTLTAVVGAGPGVRSWSASSCAAQQQAPGGPTMAPPPRQPVAAHFKLHVDRRLHDADPMPGRPHEDDIANCTFYFEAFAVLHKGAVVAGDTEGLAKATGDIAARVARMRDPRNLVMTLATLTQRRQVVPAVAAAIEARFMSDGGAAFADLNGHYLSALAFAVAAQGGSSSAFFGAVVARAAAIRAFEPHHLGNLEWACAKAGVELPADLERLPEVP